MPVPTITSVTPNLGHTGGGALVEIIGTNFREPTPQTAAADEPMPVAPPSVEVEFGGVAATKVQWISTTRLFVRTPEIDEGDYDVVLRNIDDAGDPIAGEEVTAVDAYRARRVQLTAVSDLVEVCRALVLKLRRQIHPNVVIAATHTDYDSSTVDTMNIAKVATVPALMLFGPGLEENRFYSKNQLEHVEAADPEEFFITREKTTVDVMFEYVGVSNLKIEHLNFMNAIVAFFRKNKWITHPSSGEQVEIDFETGAQPRTTPASNNDNLRSFRGSILIRGFDLGEFPGFQRDLVVAAARKSIDDDSFFDLQPSTQTGQTFDVGASPGLAASSPAADHAARTGIGWPPPDPS
jgi:hypothetical protein